MEFQKISRASCRCEMNFHCPARQFLHRRRAPLKRPTTMPKSAGSTMGGNLMP
jgi:hypothetical protein